VIHGPRLSSPDKDCTTPGGKHFCANSTSFNPLYGVKGLKSEPCGLGAGRSTHDGLMMMTLPVIIAGALVDHCQCFVQAKRNTNAHLYHRQQIRKVPRHDTSDNSQRRISIDNLPLLTILNNLFRDSQISNTSTKSKRSFKFLNSLESLPSFVSTLYFTVISSSSRHPSTPQRRNRKTRLTGFPCSVVNNFTKPSFSSSRASLNASNAFFLSSHGTFDHVLNAARAALTAASRSCSLATGASGSAERLEGLMPWREVLVVRRVPLMQWVKVVKSRVEEGGLAEGILVAGVVDASGLGFFG